MKWLERLEKRQVHDDWVESFDWGTRCLICGNATTTKRRNFWRVLNRFGGWFVWVTGISLLLAAIVLMVIWFWNGNDLIDHGGIYDWFWILLYAALGASFLYQREIIFPKEEKA